jgi:acetyltransferase
VIDATPDVRMNATFSPGVPPTGDVAFMTQSGALGVAILLAVQKLGLGFSYFASVGNKADVGAMDLLEYWENDPHTSLIAMYLESFGDPRRFTEMSKRISRRKPVIVVKSGTSDAGARAASSHTGSLAGLEVASDALLQQCGVNRVSSIEEMINVVAGFVGAPMPKGNRICIVTNAGGPAIMAADAADGHGLQIASLSDETRAAMRKVLPPEASVQNPVDMIAAAGPDEYERVLDLALSDPGVDMAIPIFVPPLMIEPIEVIRRITRVARAHDKPVFSVLMAEESYYEKIPRTVENAVPIYRFPEAAVKVAEHLNRYREWRERPAGEERRFKVDRARAQAIIDARRAAGGGYLSPDDARDVLEAYGFPVSRQVVVPAGQDVVAASGSLAFPRVLKVVGEGIVHKSDVGGVKVGIRNEAALGRARDEMEASLRTAGVWERVTGFLVQEMAAGGPSARELILGLTQDPKFGPLIMFGTGGRYVEILRDVAFRVLPVTDIDARDMVRDIRSFPLLEGVRGESRVDIEFIEELILRLAQLTDELTGLVELDMNPVIVGPVRGECRVVDVRIRVDKN